MLTGHWARRLVISFTLTSAMGVVYAEDYNQYQTDMTAGYDGQTMPVSYGEPESAYIKSYPAEAYIPPQPIQVAQKTREQYNREWQQNQLRQRQAQQQQGTQQQHEAELRRQEQAYLNQVRQQQQAARQRALQQQQLAQQRAQQQQARQYALQQQQLAQQQRSAQQYQPQAALYQQPKSQAYKGGAYYNRLPDVIANTLRSMRINESGMSTYIRNVRGGPALIAANADRPSNPASTMKLVTSYVALGTLGPGYRWPTELYVTGNIAGGVLRGDVILKGYGDPDFRENDLVEMLQALRSRGVQHIAGNVIVDRSYFQLPYEPPGAFDGKANAAYNAQPDALLYNERGSCYEFRNLKGQIQRVCPLPRNTKAIADLNTNIFGGVWKIWVGMLGGNLQGSLHESRVPPHAQLIYRHQSQPLSEILKTVNKDSNNVMARQIMLSVGARQLGAPGTPRKGAEATGRYLESRGLYFPELRLENGAGLSRIERISARNLGEMLVNAFNSPYRDALMESMPALGMEGTVRNRLKGSAARGYGRFKTGTLRNVRALAGYLQSMDGQIYAISILHNDSSITAKAKKAHDRLVEWVFASQH
ncbi:D-alanyl-D-alanine carboxypeptidase/D-alanyl-D-alanine-endopeptidase [Thiofilum flexile]|uniref:D-alanyl-D-alanine carboxypeptidase/D-alanyl-D-alanine-endopeptidase n=1 Tax=Thiofilum flexile TaxID=125627 RepID=UPI0003A2521C|nr:D-alanyl-D-alanine carboxypeptidase [Thiofilum flexile]